METVVKEQGRADPAACHATSSGTSAARGSTRRRSILVGAIATLGMATVYALVVAGASGSVDHLKDQVATDWYLLVPIMGGFGVQVGLMSELRRLRSLHGRMAAAGAAGAGASGVGMVACCAHHIADLAPFIGATGLAAFLYDYRLAFMVVGLGVNAVGISLALRHLRRMRSMEHEEE